MTDRWHRALQGRGVAGAGVLAPFVQGAVGGVLAFEVSDRSTPLRWGREAADAWTAAGTSVLRACVGRRPLRRLPRPAPPEPFLVWGPRPEHSLDGPSFGLPFLVAQLLHADAISVEAPLAATGEVVGESIRAVAGLESKLRALLEAADQSLTVLLPTENEMEARRVVEALLRERAGLHAQFAKRGLLARLQPFELARVQRWADGRSIGCELVFVRRPVEVREWLARNGAGWVAPSSVVDRERAIELLRAVSEATPIVGGAPLLRDVTEPLCANASSDSHSTLSVVTQILRRNEGGRSETIEALPPDIERRLSRRARRVALAHRLQSCVDGDDDAALAAALEQAELVLAWSEDAAPDWDTGEFRLAGAVGRAYAARLELAQAQSWQARALDGWRELGEASARSGDLAYPLCELLRLSGVLGDEPLFQALQDDVEQVRIAANPAVRGFVEAARLGALRWLQPACLPTELLQAERLVSRADWARLGAVAFPEHAARLRQEAMEHTHASHRQAMALYVRLEAAAADPLLTQEAAGALLDMAQRPDHQQLPRLCRRLLEQRGAIEAVRALARVMPY